MKDINDYLHLYLGCPCERTCWVDAEDDMPGFEKTRQIGTLNQTIINDLDFFKPKLILRPLSSMTEDESDYILPEAWEGKPTIIVNAAMTVWLLSKHFDLFGLIESELAIDATKINVSV
jgi:hypothetical protein